MKIEFTNIPEEDYYKLLGALLDAMLKVRLDGKMKSIKSSEKKEGMIINLIDQ